MAINPYGMSMNPNPYQYPQPTQTNFQNGYPGYGMNSFQQPQQTQTQIQNQLIQVNGLAGAQNYQVPPNSRLVLFDSNQDVFYLKETDAGGYATITAFQFTPIKNQSGLANEYVTRNEFEELMV